MKKELCIQHPPIGVLEVICGSMFSGKSEELIRRIRRAKIAKQTTIIFKPVIDNRYGIECVVSHDGNKVEAQPVENITHILKVVDEVQATVIGIDEAQFFPSELVAIIAHLLYNKKRIIIAGLDLDFRGAPFGSMPILLAMADKVTKLQAICILCGNDAHFTQRLVNNQPAQYDDPIIQVGAQEAYQARCRNCYTINQIYGSY